MKIFITHIQEEFQVAMVLKKWIESAFPEHCEVMVSTDPDSIPTVAQYLEKNEQALEEIKALIILCSPHSIQKPWIPFEAGCAWIRKIFIIPVCYSGISREELPQPLSIFPGFDLEERDFGQKLFMTLAKELGVSELPAIQYRQMREEINQVIETIPPGAADFSRPGAPKESAELPFESLHVQILLVLNDGFGYTSAVLAEHFRTEEKKILPLLKRLIEENYVYASPAGMGHVRYNMAKRGKSYLEEQGLI
ncbi:MAG: TIR domain-containing protein [Deltaproteobacteria bacterium]|nr:TIR domain-containing protein [Deltaproteobacteria bacterium]